MKRNILLVFLFGLFFSLQSGAQMVSPVTWSYAAKRTDNGEAVVYLKATMEKGWHVYSTGQADGGPSKTVFSFTPSRDYVLVGKVLEPKPMRKFEKVFGMDVLYFSDSVVFSHRIRLKGKLPVTVKGKLEYMTCNDSQCLPPDEVAFSVVVN